jgi:hypothetical protein
MTDYMMTLVPGDGANDEAEHPVSLPDILITNWDIKSTIFLLA